MSLKYSSTFVKVLLFPLGIAENTKYDKKYHLVCFLVYYSLVIYVTFGIVIGLMHTPDFGGIALQIGQLTVHLTSMTMTLHYKYSTELVLRLISKLKENGHKWLKAGEKMEQFIGSTVLKVFCGYYAMIFVIASSVFVGIPAAIENGVDEKSSFLIPYWYYCGDANSTSSLMNLICWKVDTALELLISNFVQTVLYTLTLHALIMYLLFYTILITNIKVHSGLLNENARQMAVQWDKCELEVNDSKPMRDYGKLFYMEFKDILNHQRFIKEFTEEVIKLVQWMVMFNILGIFSALTLAIFFTIVEKTNDTALSSKLANMSLIMIVTFFIYCYNAQTISDLNQHIFESLLQIPWYGQSISFRKNYAIALCLNQNPTDVKVCKMYEVNLPMFLSFMKTIYSVINLMLLKYS